MYTQACTAHTHIRVNTSMYSSHLYSCIYRHVQLTPIFVYTQACTAHTYIRVYIGMYCTLYSSQPLYIGTQGSAVILVQYSTYQDSDGYLTSSLDTAHCTLYSTHPYKVKLSAYIFLVTYSKGTMEHNN